MRPVTASTIVLVQHSRGQGLRDKAIAEALRVQNWYEWQVDEERPAEEAGGVTNAELLEAREMASAMYMGFKDIDPVLDLGIDLLGSVTYL